MAGRAPRHPREDTAPAMVGRRRPSPAGDGRRYAVVAARFNEPITRELLAGAQRAFAVAGVADTAVEVFWVPGSFELPQAAAELARTGRYAAVVCVGVVIRGQTPHFEYVAGEAAAGIREVGMLTGVPATFGVVTALDEAQAWARAGGEVGNRGEEAAEAALEMAEFVRRVRDRGRVRGRAGARRE
jgi:6,7-dimethyl-8-ribityllumazine synthase